MTKTRKILITAVVLAALAAAVFVVAKGPGRKASKKGTASGQGYVSTSEPETNPAPVAPAGTTPTTANTPAASGNSVQPPPVVNGKQVIKMEAGPSGYSPDVFTVRAGAPVRWEIKDVGTSGCTNAIISQDLFSGQIALTPGQASTKEFTPKKAGKYRFSCWMGMVTGTINVVDGTGF